MNDLLLNFKVLFDILLSIEEGPDLETVLLRSLRVMVRKLGCASGAVFVPRTARGTAAFELAACVPQQMRRSGNFESVVGFVNEISAGDFLEGKVDPSPVRRDVAGEKFFYIFPAQNFGVLAFVKIGNELPEELLHSLQTVTNRLAAVCRAQEMKSRLLESDERFRALVDRARDCIFVFDESGAVVDANLQAQQRFELPLDQIRSMTTDDLGIALPPGRSWGELFSEPQSESNLLWEQALRINSKAEFDAEILIACYSFGSQRRALAWIRDITKRKKLERERERGKRLVSLGLMTSGIAHDFNNMLAAILGHTELALLDVSSPCNVTARLRQIQAAGQSLEALTNQLLTFSGGRCPKLQPRDLRRIVQEILEVLRVSLFKNVDVVLRDSAVLSTVMADEAQIKQLVMNLITNAVEAYGDERGVVELAVGRVELGEEELAARGLALESGTFVSLSVKDGACGMTPEQLGQIFEPFYTTKFSGRGLGLAAAHGIVRAHSGAMDVKSALGVGTTFDVLFPAVEGVEEQIGVPEDTRGQGATRSAGTVLMVDDQSEVLEVGTLLLNQIGYEVLGFTHAREALSAFEEQRDGVLAAVVDFAMPEMNGIELFDALRSVRADLPIVLASGYGTEDVARLLRDRASAYFIQKPYTLAQLRAVLSTALSQPVRDG